MKKKLLVMLLSVTMVTGLYGCSTGNDKRTDDAAESTVASETDYTTGSPWINSNIESNVESAGEADYKDNFDLAVNGEWVKENEIKSGDYRNAYVTGFTDTRNERLLEIMQSDSENEDHNEKLVNTLYQSFMDWDSRDAAGTEPLMPYLQEIEELQDYEDLEIYITKTDYTFADAFTMYFLSNPNDSSSYILGIMPPSFFLDDTANYEDLENMSDQTKLTYDCNEKIVETVLTQCDYTKEEAEQIFERAIQFEKKIAEFCYNNDENNLVETQDQIYQQIRNSEELKKYKWYSLVSESLKAWGIEEIPALWLCEKEDYFEHLDELLSEENLDDIKDYLLAHTASSAINRLDKETFYKSVDIKNTLNGSEGYKEETEYAIDVVSSKLGWPLSKLYCDRYVTSQDKQNVYDLIEGIVEKYKEMLQEENFLSESTKEKAIEKLDKLRINCMYPDDWSEYSYDDLEISDSYFEAVTEIEQYEIKKKISEFSEPVNQDKWDDVPITQNAFYSDQKNSINILPGFVGDVLYNSDMSKEEVYGMLGAVVGHEISHAFDASGAAFDANGNRVNWWTSEDKEKFEEKTDKLVAYYDSISVWDGFSCNGELVKGEACADMGAVAVLLRMASEDSDFDYQAFFEAYARVWACNITPEVANYFGMYDTHPLNYLRVNTVVAQFQEFYDAFDVKEGDGMYIAPEDRVKVW